MYKILEDLYYGRVHPSARGFKRGSEYHKALKKLIAKEEVVESMLKKSQKKAVDEYVEAFKDANRITTIDSFMVGFRLGAKIALDIMDEESGQLIPME